MIRRPAPSAASISPSAPFAGLTRPRNRQDPRRRPDEPDAGDGRPGGRRPHRSRGGWAAARRAPGTSGRSRRRRRDGTTGRRPRWASSVGHTGCASSMMGGPRSEDHPLHPGVVVDEIELPVARGHDVTLFATGDSRTRRPAPERDAGTRAVRRDDGRRPDPRRVPPARECPGRVPRRRRRGVRPRPQPRRGRGDGPRVVSDTPVVSTMHNPYAPRTQPDLGRLPVVPSRGLGRERADVPGARRAAAHPPRDRRGRRPPGRPSPRAASGDDEGYLLFLGRFSPAKGADRAIEAALRAGGGSSSRARSIPHDLSHVRAAVEPWLDGDRIRTVGEVGGEAKRDLLAGADALLFPIEWDEPFGLVMVEALATGTPVIGFRRASVPEVVERRPDRLRRRRVDGMVGGDPPDRRDRSGRLPARRGGAVHRPPDGRRRRGDVPVRARPSAGRRQTRARRAGRPASVG